MPLQLDHLILAVNDPEKSVDFYTRILGFTSEGQREPFSVVRVTPDLVLQLAPWGTQGGEHLAFAMTRGEFEDARSGAGGRDRIRRRVRLRGQHARPGRGLGGEGREQVGLLLRSEPTPDRDHVLRLGQVARRLRRMCPT